MLKILLVIAIASYRAEARSATLAQTLAEDLWGLAEDLTAGEDRAPGKIYSPRTTQIQTLWGLPMLENAKVDGAVTTMAASATASAVAAGAGSGIATYAGLASTVSAMGLGGAATQTAALLGMTAGSGLPLHGAAATSTLAIITLTVATCGLALLQMIYYYENHHLKSQTSSLLWCLGTSGAVALAAAVGGPVIAAAALGGGAGAVAGGALYGVYKLGSWTCDFLLDAV